MAELGHLPTVYQLVYALDQHALGRRTLVQRTGITESTVRTHLNKLRTAGYVKMAKGGTTLTPAGRRAFQRLFERVPRVEELPLKELALDHKNVAALIRGMGERFRESWRYRDAAVRAGATGALLLIRRQSSWTLSDDPTPLARQNPHDASHLERAFAFDSQPGDGMVIVFGPTRRVAAGGLWCVLTELFPMKTQSGG